MTLDVIADYQTFGPHVSVVLASNTQGRLEPFVFERREDAQRVAQHLDGKGHIDIVVIYHGVELTNEAAAQRLMFGLRGYLKEVKN